MYKFVYKVFKDYYFSQYVHSYLVGYFRSEGSASNEISYLKRNELEFGHQVEFRIEKESSTLYPQVVAEWEAEDRERELERQRMSAPIPLPRIRKRWPTLFTMNDMDYNISSFKQKTANHMMSFARSLSKKHRRR